MAGNNESDINEMTNVENCDESNIMSNFEIHLTPSAVSYTHLDVYKRQVLQSVNNLLIDKTQLPADHH